MSRVVFRGASRVGQRGAGLVEVLLAVALAALILAAALPNFRKFVVKHNQDAAARKIHSLITSTRINAVKEKTAYQIVFRDFDDTPPNTVVVQKMVGGSFVTQEDGTHEMPAGVQILGSGGMDSMDTLSVGRRGGCNSGSVYVRGSYPTPEIVSIATSCLVTLP